MKKGEIFLANNKENNPHPIIFLEWIDNARFKSCIISTKNTNGNKPMTEEHFHSFDENGNEYDVIFNNSHLIIGDSFVKIRFWIEDEIVRGRLTEKGIEFVEKWITEDPILCPAPIWKYKEH